MRTVHTLTAAVAATLTLRLAPAASAISPPHPSPSLFSPQLVHTGTGPAGYQVTFRVYDPTAARMRIKGEWSFSSAADIAADPTNLNPRDGNTWQPGDFPLASPNAGSAANWPVDDMVKNDSTGVWSFTTALPSSVFTCAFYRDCDAGAPALTGCTPMADPSNPPWNTSGSIEQTSQVYVPSDPKFDTCGYSWQAPAPPGQRGTLTHLTYSSPGHVNPADQNDLAVYTPPGYDPNRTTPHPAFYLIHGGGGSEMDWSTQGDLNNILDNLIAEHLIQPMVVVMPNNPTTPQHSSELPYLWGSNTLTPLTHEQRRLSADMIAYWAQFARTGALDPHGLPSVPRYSASAPHEVAFDSDGPAVVADMATIHQCSFWS